MKTKTILVQIGLLMLGWLLLPLAAQAQTLGTTNLVESPAAGSDSVVLAAGDAWTAMANVSWLHTSASGTGNANVVFTFDANSGTTRTGTLTIAGQTMTVTQAGTSYVAANPVTTLVSSGLNETFGVAVDGAGNVYIADTGNSAIKELLRAFVDATAKAESALAGSDIAFTIDIGT